MIGRGLETNDRPIVEIRCKEIPSAVKHQGEKGEERENNLSLAYRKGFKRRQIGQHQVGDRDMNIMAAIVQGDYCDSPSLRHAVMPWTA